MRRREEAGASKANEAAFGRAVDEVADSARRLLASLVTETATGDRQVEAARAKERSAAPGKA